MSEILLTFSLTPGLTLRAKRLVDVGPEQRAALLEKYEDDTYAVAVLKAVFLAERVEVEGLEIKDLHLTMGLHPQATAVLRPTGGAD